VFSTVFELNSLTSKYEIQIDELDLAWKYKKTSIETIRKYLPNMNKIEIEYSNYLRDIKIDGKSLLLNYSLEENYYYIGKIYNLY